MPCCKRSPPPLAKHDLHIPAVNAQASLSKRKSLPRAAYSLDHLDEISIDNCYVDIVHPTIQVYNTPEVFNEYTAADDWIDARND